MYFELKKKLKCLEMNFVLFKNKPSDNAHTLWINFTQNSNAVLTQKSQYEKKLKFLKTYSELFKNKFRISQNEIKIF